MGHFAWLVLLGLLIGAWGTLIGAGGGFVLMPVLLLLYPAERPEVLTATSLVVVFFNAASGSAAYARMHRIDYRAGLLFAAAGLPGAVLGAYATAWIPRREFDAIFGVLMTASAVALLFSRGTADAEQPDRRPGGSARQPAERGPYNMNLGMALSFFVGLISSLLGIGGGIIHVPLLARVLKFPVHVATATSHLILAILALAGTAVHASRGMLSHGWTRTALLAIGVVVGAQAGAALSNRLHGRSILRGLGLALAIVGLRLLWHVVRG